MLFHKQLEIFEDNINFLWNTFRLDRNLTRTMTSARRVALYVTPVLLVSSCLNIPKFMETQTSSGSDDDDQSNGTTSGNNTDNTISKN